MKRPPLCGCCSPRKIKAVTIKGIDKATGVTIWEYGPGSFWRHHYGVDAITGIVPDLNATLDKYATGAGVHPEFTPCGDRNAATLEANCCEGLSLVKLDSLDGTTIESATLTGFFTGAGNPTYVELLSGQTITNATALSGGDFVIVGERVAFVEFVNFSSNTATKEYILHAHGLQDGHVYLKTRTSNETITIPYDSTAAEVEALFEGTSDCTAATATGGPWPLLPISIEVTWSASSGDVSAIAATATTTASEEAVLWDYTIDFSGSLGLFTLTINTIKVGTQFRLTFPDGRQFFYTSTTTDVNAFVEDMGYALGAFVAVNTGLVPGDDPGEVQWGTTATNVLTMNFVNVLPHVGPVVPAIISGGGLITDARRAGSCAAAYSTSTGEMTSAVGHVFGYSEHRPASRMFDDDDENPTVTGLNVLGILSIGSGPDDTVILTPSLRGTGDGVKASVVERWDISSGTWAFGWQVFCNGPMSMPPFIRCESGYVVCPINATLFDPDRYVTGARLQVSDADVTELQTDFATTNPGSNSLSVFMYDENPSSFLATAFSNQYVFTNGFSFRYNFHGIDTDANGTRLRLGAIAFGADGTNIYATSGNRVDRLNYVHQFTTGSGLGQPLFISEIYALPWSRSAEPQQFRFKFNGNGATTSWLDWFADWNTIHAAIIAVVGENADAEAEVPGSTSNVRLIFTTVVVDNDPVSLIELGPILEFQINETSQVEYVDNTFFISGSGNNSRPLTVEIQSATSYTSPEGLACYSQTDATLIWSRPWGTIGPLTITWPIEAWLQGDFVYAYGNIVDDEL